MLFVGEGWGKSASAFGYANRSIGRGWPTLVVQFLKGAAWNPAEVDSGRRLGIEWPTLSADLTWAKSDPARLAASAWATGSAAIASNEYGLVVLDEITHAVASGWVNEVDVVDALAHRGPTTSVIMTGRAASRRLRASADTITKFDLVKHREKRGILG